MIGPSLEDKLRSVRDLLSDHHFRISLAQALCIYADKRSLSKTVVGLLLSRCSVSLSLMSHELGDTLGQSDLKKKVQLEYMKK